MRFRRQHEPIILFARSIDATNSFAQQHSLQAVVWQLLKRGIAVRLDSMAMSISPRLPKTLNACTPDSPRFEHETV